MNGKGDKPRRVDRQAFGEGYDRVFGSKPPLYEQRCDCWLEDGELCSTCRSNLTRSPPAIVRMLRRRT